MFEAAELQQKISKDDYKRRVPGLRTELVALQQELRRAAFPVVVVFAGVDGAGKSETVNVLSEWMDPRWLVTRAFDRPTDEERERPEYWRFWRELPPKGRVGLFLSTWYSLPVLDRVYRRVSRVDFEQDLVRIADFERTLADDGALILKFWMHLDKKDQRKRLTALEDDPLTRWRVTKTSWKHWKLYERFIAAAETAIRTTSTGQAPWTIVDGSDERYRALIVAETLRDVVRQRLAETAPRSTVRTGRQTRPAARSTSTILSHVRFKSLDKETFEKRLGQRQRDLHLLQRRAAERGVSTILVFEGWDAAGKGGAIRRMTPALDARHYQVIPIAAPTDEERAHHYLWRFWRHLPRAGRVTIFDRSWYGRVLVERVEGFASPPEWRRAYVEINQFEDQLLDHGIVLVKFWLHISREEQLRRFKERERSSFKSWKITDEDWRNRKKWDAYEHAVNEMVERTSTRRAPWTLVEANDKYYARIKVLQTVCDRLESAMSKSRGR
jgi:AMP-polyphosphate phosphotransferase